MPLVTYSMNVTLDGYIADTNGGVDWGVPDEEVLEFWIERTRALGAYVLGRRLYEAMLYWETAEQDPDLGAAEREWARLWRALPKVVFSRSLDDVQGNARLAACGLVEEVARLRAELASGDIAIGGALLAAAARDQGLIDEYHLIVHPTLVGAGVPFFPLRDGRVSLELVDTRVIGRNVISMRYRPHANRSTDR